MRCSGQPLALLERSCICFEEDDDDDDDDVLAFPSRCDLYAVLWCCGAIFKMRYTKMHNTLLIES